MKRCFKIALILAIVTGLFATLGYGGYLLYHMMIDHATERITKSVAKGVGKGVGNIINPFKW